MKKHFYYNNTYTDRMFILAIKKTREQKRTTACYDTVTLKHKAYERKSKCSK